MGLPERRVCCQGQVPGAGAVERDEDGRLCVEMVVLAIKFLAHVANNSFLQFYEIFMIAFIWLIHDVRARRF